MTHSQSPRGLVQRGLWFPISLTQLCLVAASMSACGGHSDTGSPSDGGLNAVDGETGDTGGSDGSGAETDLGELPPLGEVSCRDDVTSDVTIALSGAIDCQVCGAVATLWLYDNAFLEGDPLCTVSVDPSEPFDLAVPAELGPVVLFGFGDDEGFGTFDPGEPYGLSDPNPVELGSDDVTDVLIVLLAPEDVSEEAGGAIDEFGDAISPDRLLVRFVAGTTDLDAAGLAEDLGAELLVWLDTIDTGVVVFDVPEDATDEALLDPLRALEAELAQADDVEAVFRDYHYGIVETRTQSEDNQSLSATDQTAWRIIALDESKTIFDQCAYHLSAPERAVSVVVGVVDNDLAGAQAATELTGLVTSLSDHHQHQTREFCGTTPGGFQRLCEPVTSGRHGSLVTSAIGALNNGSGHNGVLAGFQGTTAAGNAYNLTYSFRLFNIGHGSSFTSAELLNGMQAAGESDAQVINMSLSVSVPPTRNVRGYFNTYRSFADLVTGFPSKVWVMAAGNDGANLGTAVRLATLDAPNLIVVGATDALDNRSVWDATHSSAFGATVVDIGAPGSGVYVTSVPVTHTGTTLHPDVTTTVSPTQTYASTNGTSLSTPLVVGALAFLRAFDAGSEPAELLRRVRNAADLGPAGLGGRRLNMARLITAERAGALNTTTTYLFSFFGEIEASSGGCEVSPLIGMECMPVMREGNTLSSPGGITDDAGNTYTLSGSISGSNAVTITITGLGVTAGVGPASTTYTGTATIDPTNAANLVITGGSFVAQTRTADGAPMDCDYSGTYDAVLRGVTLP